MDWLSMSSFTIASWNINSIRARSHLVMDWLEKHPECLAVVLQEIKCEESQFPACFEEAGYHVAIKGQKAYNGVAIISREKLDIRLTGLEGQDDSGSRYIEAGLPTPLGEIILGNLYLPNGNSNGEIGLQQKFDFFEALRLRGKELLEKEANFIFLGDFNVCPSKKDYAPNILPETDALLHPQSIAGWRSLEWLGLTDALRALHPNDILYTFYDYQGGAFQRGRGLRIDHALLTPKLAELLEKVEIDIEERDKEKPSDHCPLIISFSKETGDKGSQTLKFGRI
ncbi:exodeoxyribonuclease iii [Lasius niger]|uniref:exodeoxyribonuclease III n=1 Tax=Lasius niger TaxID=67767 RepID=A0A0J7NBP2_LASNI|nr:exodeoxyribonuclease iii [Lasius niger]